MAFPQFYRRIQRQICFGLFTILTFLSAQATAEDTSHETLLLPPSYEAEIEKVIASGAALNPQWLKLGHYRPRGFVRKIFRSDFRSEADGHDFFLSAKGKNSPEDELRETLRSFGAHEPNDDSAHTQCVFPARRTWAFKTLGWEQVLRQNGLPVLPCAARMAWKKRLDATGVSLVFASAYLNNAASMFGHTFLKFHSRGTAAGKELLDYGVNFAAETGNDGGVPFAVFGMIGVYPGRFSMQPFHQTLRTYANLEGRDLIEYRLDLTAAEIDFFVDHLFELERTYFDYYFLTENCSYFLLAALEAAKPELNLSQSFFYQVIPADSVRKVAREPGLVSDTKYRPSLNSVFRAQAESFFEDISASDLESIKSFLAELDSEKPFTDPSLISTKALDLAIDYGAMRATSSPNYDRLNHRLRSERARRGGASTSSSVTTPKRPEEGHDPGRFGLFGSSTSSRLEFGLDFRFANHDRLSLDDGYLKGTTLEVFRTKLMISESPRLTEFTVLNIFSSQPYDRFNRPTSWTISFGLIEPTHEPVRSLGPYLRSALGPTLEFKFGRAHEPSIWISALIGGELLSNPDIQNRWSAHLGPEIKVTAFLHERWKLGVDARLERALTPSRNFEVIAAELVGALSRNFEIRAESKMIRREGLQEIRWTLGAYQHQLF